MHCRNISFHTQEAKPVRMAPVYDMLPMLYFPSHGQIVNRPFEPLPSAPSGTGGWQEACAAAEEFWARVSAHTNISDDFKSVARENVSKIKALSNGKQTF